MKEIKPYHSAISKWDKILIAQTFSIAGKENTKYAILVTIDVYGMSINNPDVKLVIQWDIPMFFNLMIQQIGKTDRRDRASAFLLFTSKWTKIKDPTKIEKCTNRTFSNTSINAQLSNNNHSKLSFKISFLNQVVNANDNLSKLESIARSETDLDFNKEADLFLGTLTIDIKQKRSQKKKKKQAS